MPDWARWFDVGAASAGLLVFAPLLAASAIAIKLDSKGPVLFRHERVGRSGRKLVTLKLRTMAEDLRGSEITARGDARITRVGRWLRLAKIDELPQLWNVLKGEMSIVGPRPEVPRYAAMYRPEWSALLAVRPGLTDRASIAFRHEEALLALANDRERAYTEVIMPLKLGVALEGLHAPSLREDLRVIFETLGAVAGLRSTKYDHVLEAARRQIDAMNRGTR